MAACNQSWVDCSGFSCIGAALKTAATCTGKLGATIVTAPGKKLKSDCLAYAQSYTDAELAAHPFEFAPTGLLVDDLAVWAQPGPGQLATPAQMRARLEKECSDKDWTGQALTGWVKKKAPKALAGAALGALESKTMDELLSYLPGPVKNVALCIVDKAGADAYVAAAEAAAGNVDDAAKRLAPYAAGCGLLEVADQLGTGLFSDILRKIAGQLTKAPGPKKEAVGFGYKDVCYYHYEGAKKTWRCPGDPGYQPLAGLKAESFELAAKGVDASTDLINVNKEAMISLASGQKSGTQAAGVLPILLVLGLVWAVS